MLAGPAMPAAQEPAAAPPATQAGAGADGFVIASEDGDFRLQLRGYVQFDGRFYPGTADDAGGTDTFLLRRVRPILQGTLGRYFDFNLTPDFGGGAAALQDAYVEARPSEQLRLRVGKFKPPVGLERLQSATALPFVERALPAGLVPNRDVGAQVQGELASGVVAYAFGVFNGAPDGGSLDGDGNGGKDVAARLFFSPFRASGAALNGLSLGAAATTGRQDGTPATYRTGGQVPMFTYVSGVVADGTRTRLAPQLSFYAGPFALIAEYVRSRSALRRDTGAAARLGVAAWQATVSLGLTGDAASSTGVRPRRPYDPARRQWGALELVARVNGFRADGAAFSGGFADPDTSARKALAWGVGLNWYLTRNVKQVVSFERTTFTGGAGGGADRPAENALFIRTQLAF
jgi:phosphate-selective porin OprO/OprP